MEYFFTFGIFAFFAKRTKIGKCYLKKFAEKINFGNANINNNNKIYLDWYISPLREAIEKTNKIHQLNFNQNQISQKEYLQKLKDLKRTNYEIVKFDYYENLKNVEINVDSENLEGDSFADLYYNSNDKASNKNNNFINCNNFI